MEKNEQGAVSGGVQGNPDPTIKSLLKRVKNLGVCIFSRQLSGLNERK